MDRRVVVNYKGKASFEQVIVKILKLLAEDKERGVVPDAAIRREQCGDLREDQQR